MDLASHLGRFFHRTSQPAFYARFVAASLLMECLSLMIPVTEKKCKYLALIFGKNHKCTYHDDWCECWLKWNDGLASLNSFKHSNVFWPSFANNFALSRKRVKSIQKIAKKCSKRRFCIEISKHREES